MAPPAGPNAGAKAVHFQIFEWGSNLFIAVMFDDGTAWYRDIDAVDWTFVDLPHTAEPEALEAMDPA